MSPVATDGSIAAVADTAVPGGDFVRQSRRDGPLPPKIASSKLANYQSDPFLAFQVSGFTGSV